MQAFGDKQMVDQVLIRLHAFYPQARGSFTGYEIRRYSTDPSMGGAYLAFGPGPDQQVLAPVGTSVSA